MMARMIRKMHVPAYCPVVAGVHDDEKSGVFFAVLKYIGIDIAIPLDMSIVAAQDSWSVVVAKGVCKMRNKSGEKLTTNNIAQLPWQPHPCLRIEHVPPGPDDPARVMVQTPPDPSHRL